MSNLTFIGACPSLPRFTLTPAPSIISHVPDLYLSLGLPIVAYWGWGMIFHCFDIFNLFGKYRIHTPAEFKKRNVVPVFDVVVCVLIQQTWQIGLGIWLYSGPHMKGSEHYDVAVWAARIRLAQSYVPAAFMLFGIDAQTAAWRLAPSLPTLAGILNGGGKFFVLDQAVGDLSIAEPKFLPWEIFVAKILYFYLVPALRFGVAIVVGDSWQYFLHRISHEVGWIYRNFHSVHHRVYCPYAFGAFYANLAEAFVWDVGGTGLALWLSGLNDRQAMWFTTLSVIKSCDDHCGYLLPYDPFQLINRQTALYHNIHHQSWGMKTNYAQVYTTFWDWALGTQWTVDDLHERYERGKRAAERSLQRETEECSK